jgi:ribosomal-protein-alanine N-acetyltransferase
MTIETERLLLRAPVLADIPALFAFLGDPDAMRHTHVVASTKECRSRVAVHEYMRRRNGFAPWTIVNRNDGATIGWGGLYKDPFDPGWGVEAGYFFRPSAWGFGYATELLQASLKLADGDLNLPEVRAFASPDNRGSRRVLEKAGFERLRFVPEMNRLLYRRERR